MTAINASTFDLNIQDEHVRRHGDFVGWKQAFKCPCGNKPDANRSNVNCKACGGLGLTYAASKPLRGLTTGIRHEKQLMEAGVALPGDMVLGLSPYDPIRLSDWDLIRLTWDEGQPYEGELVVRGDADDDETKFDIANVSRLFTMEPSTGQSTDYTVATDFSVSGRVITWLTENRPRAGAIYSVKYDVASYDWVCFVTPMQRFERGTSLGRRALLRKRDVVVSGSTSAGS